MIVHPSGTILVTKVTNSNDFVEETLELADLTASLIGTSGSLITSNGTALSYLTPGSNGSNLSMVSGSLQWRQSLIDNIDGGVPSTIFSISGSIDGGGV